MIVTTSSDTECGFQVKFDDQVIVRTAQLPKTFSFQSTNNHRYFGSRQPLNFFSRRRTVLSDANRIEVAAIEKGLFLATLRIGEQTHEQTHRIKFQSMSLLASLFGNLYFEIKDLGLRFDCKERFFSYEVKTEFSGSDAFTLAVIVLIHYEDVHRWRET